MKHEPVVGVVGLGEAGNLGDDLILAAVVQAVDRALPGARVRHLSYGEHLDWQDLGARLGLSRLPERAAPVRPLPWSTNHRLFADADVVLVGGGGLLQTSHHPLQPFLWLDHLPTDRRIPVIGVGLGMGPLSPSWRRTFLRRPSPFDELYVRDDDSATLSGRDLGWPAARCLDFVDETFLRDVLAVPARPVDGPRSVGVSLRRWPDLDADDVAQHVRDVAASSDCDRVDLFVLEAKGGRGQDVTFSEDVAGRLGGLTAQVHTYRPAQLTGFLERMSGCTVAVGMKLHACAVWAAAGVPVHPVVYAPKVAAFYGLPYRGTQIVGDVVAPAPAWHSGAPRAADVVRDVVPRAVPARGAADRFSMPERLRYRSASAMVAVRARVPALRASARS